MADPPDADGVDAEITMIRGSLDIRKKNCCVYGIHAFPFLIYAAG